MFVQGSSCSLVIEYAYFFRDIVDEIALESQGTGESDCFVHGVGLC